MTKNQAAYWGLLAQKLASDARLTYLIKTAINDDASISCYLQFQLQTVSTPSDLFSGCQLYSAFAAFCGCNHSLISENLLSAMAECKTTKADHDMAHKHLVLSLCLNWKSTRQQFIRDEHLTSLGVPAMCERLKSRPPIHQ
jgi:hypothetical protein